MWVKVGIWGPERKHVIGFVYCCCVQLELEVWNKTHSYLNYSTTSYLYITVSCFSVVIMTIDCIYCL